MSWLGAQTIPERRDALRAFHGEITVDKGLADERLKAWRSLRAFRDDELFKKRLAVDGLSEDEFYKIIGANPDDYFAKDYQPLWVDDVLSSELNGKELNFKSTSFWGYATRGILAPYMPMICQAANELHAWVSRNSSLRARMGGLTPDDLLDLMLAPALQRIEYYHRSAVILEVNVMRLLGELEGETPEERFAFFKKKMISPEARREFQMKYAVQTRSLQRTLKYWLSVNKEFLSRLDEDWDAIRAQFGITADDVLEKVDTGSGDVHNKGRSVSTVTFKSGKKILYKPRSLTIDEHFRALVQWCNEHEMNPPVQSVDLISRDEYGWVEFINKNPVSTPEDHAEFYRRLGGLIALLHVLSTVDIHFENIVARGVDPYVIDMETLFHINLDELEIKSASDFLARRYRDSVMSIGILPTPVLAGEGKTFDTSAIGASVNQQAPYKVLGLVNMGRDDVNISHIPGWIPSVHNRPSEDDTLKVPGETIIEGFESGYRFLMENRKKLLAKDGPLAAFENLRARLIARNTRFYGTLFMEAIHPDYSQDEIEHALLWDEIWTDVPGRPLVEHFIASEYEQIRDGDIPFFMTNINDANDIVGSDGTRITDVKFSTGFERSKRTLREMSLEEMRKQVWYMRASLGATDKYELKPVKNAGAYLKMATEIGDEVLKQLGQFQNMASSYHVNGLAPNAYSVGTSGADLYEGNSGIAFFLAYLGNETGQSRFTEAARALINDVLTIMKSRGRAWNNISGFIGAPSLAYVLTHLAALWNDHQLINEAASLANSLRKVRPDEKSLDVLLGPAGTLLAILPLARTHQGDALELALNSAKYLLKDERWRNIEIKRGFSHGLTGVAFAFKELSALTGDDVYSLEAEKMLAHERELLSGGRWTDVHNYNGRPQVSWCHGASGIALGRLGIYAHDSSLQIRTDIEEALTEVKSHYWMESQCLCHGSLGNLEPLIVARKFPEFASFTNDLEDHVAKITNDVVERGWRSMLPNQTLGLDLFTGLSGLGYGFLRLHDAEAVPSVMLLAPPLKPLTPQTVFTLKV